MHSLQTFTLPNVVAVPENATYDEAFRGALGHTDAILDADWLANIKHTILAICILVTILH